MLLKCNDSRGNELKGAIIQLMCVFVVVFLNTTQRELFYFFICMFVSSQAQVTKCSPKCDCNISLQVCEWKDLHGGCG